MADFPAGPPDGRQGVEKNAQVLMFGGYLLAGFSLLSLEIIWGRMTALTLGSSVHSYTVTLASVMGGIFAGSFHGGKRSPTAAPPVFFLYLLLYSISSILVSFAFLYLSDLMFFAKFHLPVSFEVSFCLMYVAVFVLIFVPSFFAGAVFPIAVQRLVRDAGQAGVVTARLYMLNTLGAVAGCLLTGFVFVEYFGLKNSALLCGILPGVPSAAYFISRKHSAAALLSILALVSLAGAGAGLSFPVYPFSIYIQKRFQTPEQFCKIERDVRLLKSYENKYGIVKVLEDGKIRFLQINSKNESSLFAQDFPTQSMLAHLPYFYHPNPGGPLRFLNIGLGTGTTVRIASNLVKEVDCLEIDPNVYRAVTEFFFRDIDKNKNVRYIFKEARHFLGTTDRKYDIISMEPSYPTDITTASLLSRESFLSLKAHLHPDGIAAVYAPGHLLHERYTDGVLKTLAGVFPYMHIWNVGIGDVIFICALQPLRLTPDQILEKAAEQNPPGAIRFARRNEMIESIRQSADVPVYSDNRATLESAALRGFVRDL